MKRLTPSGLRADIYRILDRVLETGMPVEITRGERRLRIVRVEKTGSKLDRLQAHPNAIVGDPEELAEIDWSGEWRP